jgi:hypothetical protein
VADLDRMDRRNFARQLAAGTGCLAALAAQTANAADVPPAPSLPQDPAAKPAPAPAPAPAVERPEIPPAEILLLTHLVRAYPSEHFDDAAIQGILRDIRGDLARGEMLAEFALKNSDEPAFQFRAYRGPEGLAADG